MKAEKRLYHITLHVIFIALFSGLTTFTSAQSTPQLAFDPDLDGSQVPTGEPFEVSWTDNIDQGQFDLDYWYDNQWNDLVTLDASESSYTVNTPKSWSGPAKLSIASTWYPGVADTLHDMELVYYLNVTSPSAGVIWKTGDIRQIAWKTNASEGQVTLELLNANETMLGQIADQIYTYVFDGNFDSGYYQWTIPVELSNGYRIEGGETYKVRVFNADVSGVSDAFTIDWGDYVSLTQPAAGAYQPGEQITIRFASNVGSVSIDLLGPYEQNIETGYSGHATSLPNDKVWHSYNWTLPADLQGGTYYVHITAGTTETTSGALRVVGETVLIVSYDAYDAHGNVLQTTDANGHITRYYYGTNTQPLAQSTSGINGAVGVYLTGISRESSGGNLPTTATYDVQGRLETLTGEDSVTTAFSYDGLGRLDMVRNEAGQPVGAYQYVYTDDLFTPSNPNFIKTTAYPGGGDPPRISTGYFDGLGRPVQTQQRVGANDIVTATAYDTQGRVWKSYKPYRYDTDHGYDAGYTAHATGYYDGAARPDDHGYPFAEQLYEASPLNRPARTIPAGGEVASGAVTTDYDVRPWTYGGETYSYVVTTTTDEEGNETETWRDGWGRTVRTIADPTGIAAETVFDYDPLGNLTKVIAPNGLETTYTYDTRGQLIAKTSPDAGTVRYKYDAAGNLRFTQDANQTMAGEITYTGYDELGRRVREGVAPVSFAGADPDTENPFETVQANLRGAWAYGSKPDATQFPWDQFSGPMSNFSPSNPEGQLVAEAFKFTDQATVAGANHWQLTLYSYDSEGRVAEKWIYTGDRSDWTTHLAYEYNRLGEVIRQKIEIGAEVLYQHYTYNQRGLLEKMYLTDDGTVDTEPTEITYSYTPTGAVNQITYRNGSTTVTNSYDIRDRLTDINNINSTSGSPFAAHYEYEKNSNVGQASFWNPNITTGINLSSAHRTYTYDYTYDNLSRLKTADYKLDSSNPLAFDMPAVTYDDAGNIDLLQRYDQAGTLVDDLDYDYTDGTNQLSTLTDNAGSSHLWDPTDGSFTYDANGNLTSMTGNPDLSNVTYNYRNLPINLDLPGNTQQINSYNADGQRILKEVRISSGTTWSFYIRDGLSTLGMILDGELQYLNILGNDLAGRVVANSGAIDADNAKRYYLKDLLGSTRAVVDQNGTVTENRDYYPFGLLMDERQYVQGTETTEKFTGKERDGQTGFDYFGARFYSSGLGRFLSVDPLADQFPSWSPYSYAYNNPLKYIDPSGMAPTCAEEENCDEIYEEGAMVSNRLGQWKYLGNNQWQTLSLAEGVDEITSGLGYAFHRFENTVGYEYYDFGQRILAERIMDVSGNAGALEWFGGPRIGAVKGIGWLRSLLKGRRAAKGVSVIGPRATYRQFAKEIGANFLDVADNAWTWPKNERFLAGIVKRGDDVVFAGKFNPARLNPNTPLAREIRYLIKHGYQWADDFSRLIKK